jgi:hypothetical protein
MEAATELKMKDNSFTALFWPDYLFQALLPLPPLMGT